MLLAVKENITQPASIYVIYHSCLGMDMIIWLIYNTYNYIYIIVVNRWHILLNTAQSYYWLPKIANMFK